MTLRNSGKTQAALQCSHCSAGRKAGWQADYNSSRPSDDGAEGHENGKINAAAQQQSVCEREREREL